MSIGINGMNNLNIMQQSVNIKKEANNLEDFQSVLENAVESGSRDEVRQAAIEMEGFFINMMLNEMRKTVPEPQGLFKRSQAEVMMREKLDQQISMDIAKSGGIGLADKIYNQLLKKV